MSSTRSLIATIAGFSALGLALIAVVYWAFFANPPLSFAGIDWPLRILVVLAIIAFSVYLLAAPETIGQAAGRRSNRLTANALVASIIAIGVGILLNVIVGQVPAVRADLTAGQTFTLSDQSIQVIKNLKRPVDAIAFYSDRVASSTSRQQIEDELKAYQAYSSNFKYEFVDPYTEPARANEYNVRQLGSVVFDNGQKHEIATNIAEADFTSALVRLEQTGTPTVAFLTGDGERDPDGTDQNGYSTAKSALTQDNYNVKSLSLVTSTLTITDVNVLVIAEPQKALTSKEVSDIGTYLDQGGHVMIMLDPEMKPDVIAPFTQLLSKYGVTPELGGVIDLQHGASQQDPTVLAYNTYQDSPITKDLNTNQFYTIFPFTMALKSPTSTVGVFTTNPLIQSSAGDNVSWLETDLTSLSNGTFKYDAGKDTPGPNTIALTIAPSDTSTSTVKTKLAVYGDADFPSNLVLQQQQVQVANQDLFANTVSWLAGQNDLVSIRPKPADQPRTITLDNRQQTVMLASTVCGLPLLILLVGGYIWWRRR